MKKMLRYIAMMGIVGMLVGMLPGKVYALNPQEEGVRDSIGGLYGMYGEDYAYQCLKKFSEDYADAGKPLNHQVVQDLVNKGLFPNYVDEIKALGYTDVDYSPVTGGASNTAPVQEDTPTPAPEPAAFTVEDMPETPMWATSEVNCRNGASTDYAKVGSLKQNDRVTVNDKASTGWYRFVLEDGTEAYVSDKYLTTEDPNAAAEPAEPEPEETAPAVEPEPEPEPVVETPEPAVEEPKVETPKPVVEEPETETAESPEPITEEPVTQEPEQIAEPPVVEDESTGNRIPIAVGAVAGICVIGAAVVVLIRKKKG